MSIPSDVYKFHQVSFPSSVATCRSFCVCNFGAKHILIWLFPGQKSWMENKSWLIYVVIIRCCGWYRATSFLSFARLEYIQFTLLWRPFLFFVFFYVFFISKWKHRPCNINDTRVSLHQRCGNHPLTARSSWRAQNAFIFSPILPLISVQRGIVWTRSDLPIQMCSLLR